METDAGFDNVFRTEADDQAALSCEVNRRRILRKKRRPAVERGFVEAKEITVAPRT